MECLNIIPSSDCCGCGSCVAACPRSCIDIKFNEEGFLLPYIDSGNCINCQLCKKVCPVFNAPDASISHKPLISVAAVNSSADIISKSSSGGVFSAIAQHIIERGGVIYGVEFYYNVKARHTRIEDVSDLSKVRGSKYIPSDNVCDAYKSVKADLLKGLTVLFSGTPCHIAGLKNFLQKDYDQLLCVEVVCHGLPSILAYEEYLRSLELRECSKIQSINFRDKSEGWQHNKVTITFENGRVISGTGKSNPFMRGYIANLYIRESCTDCRFKSLKSGADLTLGDMWGLESVIPDYPAGNGVSMLFANTSKGLDLLKACSDYLSDIKEFKFEDILPHNSCVEKSVVSHTKSSLFYQQLGKKSFEHQINELLKPSVSIRLKQLYKRMRILLSVLKHKFTALKRLTRC